MNNKLDELYSGDLVPGDLEQICKHSERYSDLTDAQIRTHKALMNQLEFEDARRFEEYDKATEELSAFLECEAFKTGFSLALQFVLEALSTI